MKFASKLRIYIASFFYDIFLSIVSFFLFNSIIILAIINIGYFIIHIWFVHVVYKDLKMRGESKNWLVAILLLGIIGGIIYYYNVKDKPFIKPVSE